MSDTRTTTFSFKLSVGAALLVPITGLAVAVAFREWVMFPGALISSALYAALACFALRGRDWARWILFAFTLGTAMLGIVFTFIRPGGGSPAIGLNPWAAIMTGFYGLIALGLALRPHRLRSPA